MDRSARRLGIVFPFMAVMLMLTLAACGGSATAPDDTVGLVPNAITGVLSDASGAPLAGRQVSVSAMTVAASAVRSVATGRALNDGVARSSVAITDARGVFSVPVSHAGTYGLTSVGDSDGAYVTVAVHVDTDGELMQAGEVRMASTPLGAISGQVDGPGAGVFVFALGTSFSAVTDASGAFTMTRVPAGSYQVVAGFPGSTTAPVTVTVTSGATTSLPSAIAFGPRIDGVDPSGFVAWVWDDKNGRLASPLAITITGSGFGSRQALSVLRYADTNVEAAIRSWTDTEIVVDGERIEQALNGPSRIDFGTPVEAFVFEVVTAAGSVFTAPVGVVTEVITSGWDSQEGLPASDTLLRVLAHTFSWHLLPGVTYVLDVENGQALAAADLSPISSFTTAAEDPWDSGTTLMHLLFIRQTSGLPAVVTFDPRGTPHFDAIEPTTVVVGGNVEFELDDVTYASGRLGLAGTVLSWDGQPMPDDGNFALSVREHGEEPVSHPIAIDSAGRFETTVATTIPDSAVDLYVSVGLMYRGTHVAATGYGASGSFELDGDVYGWGGIALSGTVTRWDGQPMPDDGQFAIALASYGEPVGTYPVTLDGDGRFVADVTIPILYWGTHFTVTLMHGASTDVAYDSFQATGSVDIDLDVDAVAWGDVELAGTVLRWDDTPMPDDGYFSLTLSVYGDVLGSHPITLDGDGRFSIALTIPAEYAHTYATVTLMYQGTFEIAYAGFYVDTSVSPEPDGEP